MRNESYLDSELRSCLQEFRDEIAGIACRPDIEFRERLTSVCEMSKTVVGRNPTTSSDHFSGGVSSYSQSIRSWYDGAFSHAGHRVVTIGAHIQIADSPSST